jgi:TonB-linked SusC/RagA family outer membrane protein
MKKNHNYYGLFKPNSNWHKLLLTMKISAFLSFCCLMNVFATPTYSQLTKISLNLKDATIEEVLNKIEDVSEFYFLYNNKLIDVTRKVNIEADKEPIKDILNDMFDKDTKFIVYDRQIILMPSDVTSLSATMQQLKITGTVTDKNGAPLPGVNVVVTGTTQGSMTDIAGKYSIDIPKGSKSLTFSFIGMESQEVNIGTLTQINVTMVESAVGLQEVIIVGYGSTTKRATTASISTISSEKLELPVPTLADAINGKIDGVFVQTSGGGPGKKPIITIRGGSTPLIVIDGIVSSITDFQDLNANDIEDFSVLKDAEGAAVFGARGGNGVIAITTKRGVTGTMKINYDYSLTLSQPTVLPEKFDSYESVTIQNEARKNDNQAPAFTDDIVQKYKDNSDPFNYPNTNWYKVTLNTFAPSERHNLSINGGNDKTKYFASVSYLDQGDLYVFQTDWLKRYNYKLSVTNNFDKIGLIANVNLSGTIDNRREPFSAYSGAVVLPGTTNGIGSTGSLWSHIQAMSPTQLAYTDLGLYAQTSDSPIVEVDPNSGYNSTLTQYVNGILDLEWSVPGVKGLVIKAINQYRLDNNWFKSWMATAKQYSLHSNIPIPITAPNLVEQSGQGHSYTNQFLGEYKKTFAKDHTVNALFGYERSYGYNETLNATRLSYILINDQISSGPTLNMTNGSSAAENARAGFFGRLGYNYKSKYFIEASFRRDGSDWFPPNKRWGTFWSGSAGWIVSSENFMKTLVDKNIINFLKLRASYGVVGLDGADAGISRYQYLQSYIVNQMGYLINNAFVPTFTQGPLVSPNLTWYTQKSRNIGIDFATLNSKISGSFDYFFMETTGMLASPSSTIYSDPLGTALPAISTNGNLRKAGLEISLSYKNNIGDFHYTIGGNLSRYLQMWKVDPYEDISILKNPYTRTTYQTNFFGIGYQSLGFYTTAADVMNSPRIVTSTNLVPGDIKYQDINGDGKIDVNDQKHIGQDYIPRITYGVTLDLQYKGWFLSALVQGSGNRDLYPGPTIQSSQTYTYQGNFWTPTNTNAIFPRLTSNPSYNNNNDIQQSSFWLVNGSFIRLKSLQIGYDFKKLLIKSIKFISECSLSIGGTNLLTASPALRKYKMDPEAGLYTVTSTSPPIGNNYDYPVERTYFFKATIGF